MGESMSYRVPTPYSDFPWVAVLSPIVLVFVMLMVGQCSCDSRAHRMNLRSDWGPIQGCMVRTPRGWFPIESVRDYPQGPN